MSFLARFRILTKILSVIALLGAAAAFGAWYAGGRMTAIDDDYVRFLIGDARASSTAPRLNRTIVLFQAIGYRIIAETDMGEKRKLMPEFDKAGAEVAQFSAQIKRLVPRHAAVLERVEQYGKDVTAATKAVGDLALAGESGKALALMGSRANPLLDQMLVEVRAMRDRLDKDIEQGSRDLSAQSHAAVRATYLIVGSSVLAALALAFFVSRFGIAVPLGRVRDVLMQLAGGDKSVDIPHTERGDEVGEMARTAQTFRDNLVRMEAMEAEQRNVQARTAADKKAAEEREARDKRDNEERLAAERKATMQMLAGEFEAAVGHIVGTVSSASTELEAAAGTLTKTAETTQQLSATVAAASEQASSNVQTVASATSEMTSSVQEIGRQVHESARIARNAVQQVETTDVSITTLSQAAGRIGDVVKLITAIAEQTNLLALNATIEAARAGAAGKGFAVVASEVKLLAAQTAKATGEIGTQIAGMQAATQDSVGAIQAISGTIHQLSDIAATIAAAVEEQNAATQEIARNIHEASRGTAEVAGTIVKVNEGAGETGAASTQVLTSARQLSGESSRLKTEVDKFLATVRAA